MKKGLSGFECVSIFISQRGLLPGFRINILDEMLVNGRSGRESIYRGDHYGYGWRDVGHCGQWRWFS